MAEQMGLAAMLSVQDNGFARGLKSAERSIASFDKKASQMATGVSKAYTGAVTSIVTSSTTMAATAGAAFTAFAVSSAADARVIEAQYGQAFKGLEKQADDTINKMSKKFNILPERLMGPMSSLQSYFKGTGMDASDALQTTTAAMNIAADSAAYYDKSLEDTYGSLKGFLMGNFENGDAIGINTNLTKIATAYNEDYGASFKDLSDAAQTDYLLEYISNVQTASGVTGQAARESEEWGNVLGNLQSAIGIFAKTAGDPLLDPLIKGMQLLTDYTLQASTNLGGFIETLSGLDSVGEKGQYIWDLIEPLHALMAAGGAGVGLASMLPVLGQLGGGVGVLGKSFEVMGSGASTGIGSIAKKLGDLKGKMNFSGLKMPSLSGKGAVPDMDPTSTLVDALKSVDGIDEVYSKRLADSFGSDGSFFDKLSEYMNSSDADKIDVPDSVVKSVLDGQSALEGMIGSMDELGTSSQTTLGGILGKFTLLGEKGGGLTSMLGGLKGAALPAVSAIGGAVMGVAGASVKGIQMLLKASMAAFNIAAIGGAILAGMGYFYQTFQSEIDAFINKVISKGPSMIKGLADGIISKLPTLINSGAQLLARLIEMFSSVGPVALESGMTIIFMLVQGIIDNMDIISSGISQLISFILTSIGTYLPTILLMGAEVLLTLVQGIAANQGMLSGAFGTLLTGLITLVAEGLPMLFEIGKTIITFLANGLIDNKDLIIGLAITIMSTLILGIMDLIPFLLDTGLNLIVALVEGIVNNKDRLMTAGKEIVGRLTNWIANGLPEFLKKGLEIILWLVSGIAENIPELIIVAGKVVGALLGALWSLVSNHGQEILSLGIQIADGIVTGLLEGIINGVGGLINLLTSSLNNLGDFNIGVIPEFHRYGEGYDKNVRKAAADQMVGLTTASPGRNFRTSENSINQQNTSASTQAANIHLNMGGSTFNGFTNDLYNNNDQQTELYNNY